MSRLFEQAHQIPPTTITKIEDRKIGRRPMAIAKGIATRFPTPMNKVGYVKRSLALSSCPGYEATTDVKIGPSPEARTTAEQPYAATRTRIARFRQVCKFRGSVILVSYGWLVFVQ